MSYLLDTNVCVDALKGHPGVCARLAAASPADCAVSTVTAFELLVGVHRCAQPEREARKVERFLAAVTLLPFDRTAASVAAKIRHEIESAGTKIGPYDLLIAGHALAAGLTLVTNNTREFQRVPRLALLDWRSGA